MIGRSSSFLGVAVLDRAITCAELASSGDRRAVRHTATFVFPQELSLETPDATGQALATFLRQKKFTTTRAVVGLPARWLVAVEKEVPPADPDQAHAALRLQAERLAVAESGEVVFDYAGAPKRAESSRVLLVGMLRQKLENVERLMDAAGMTVVAITSTGLALSAAAAAASAKSGKAGEGGVLVLAQGGGELIWRTGDSHRMLRHVTLAVNGQGVPPAMSTELRRVVAMAPTNGTVQSRSLLLLDGIGLENQEVTELSERLGVPVHRGGASEVLDVSALELTTTSDEGGPAATGKFASATALALAGARPELLPLDFKHSRLTPPKPQRISRNTLYGVAFGALLLIVIITMYVMVHSRESKLAAIQSQLKQSDGEVKKQKGNIDKLTYGRGFFVSRTPILETLKAITENFGDEDKIWTSTFTIKENGRGTLTGRANSQQTALLLLSKLQKDKRFSEVKSSDLRQADTRSGEWSFTISFVCNNPG